MHALFEDYTECVQDKYVCIPKAYAYMKGMVNTHFHYAILR